MRSLLLALAALATTLPLTAASLEVRVSHPNGATIQDAVVYAIPPSPMPLARRVAVMDQMNRQFLPHVLPVQSGTWVEFPNSDNVRHTVFSVSPARRFQLPLYIGKPARPIQFPNPGVVHLGCNIHEQMSAWIVVVDTPYFATAAGGKATLTDLPAGKYTVRVWHPGMSEEPNAQSVTLAAADQSTLSFVAAGK